MIPSNLNNPIIIPNVVPEYNVQMSDNNTTKKRKVDSDEGGISLAAVLAEMQEMKSKLSRMDELESRCISMQHEMDGMRSSSTIMQNEINSMKDRISHIDELENKCDLLQRSIQILSKESTWEEHSPPLSVRGSIQQYHSEKNDLAAHGLGLRST